MFSKAVTTPVFTISFNRLGASAILFSVCVGQLIDTSYAQSLSQPPTNGSRYHVYDSKGVMIGDLVNSGVVMQQINGSWVSFPFSYSGLKSDGVTLYYASKNCVGTAYISANDVPINGKIFIPPEEGDFLVDGIFANSGTLVFANAPFTTIRVQSVLAVSQITPLQGSCSEIETKMNAFVGSAGTIKLGPYKIPFYIK